MLTNNAKEVQATPPSHFEVPIVILSDNIWVRWAPKLIWYPWNLSDLVIWVVGVSCSHWYKQWGVTKIWAKNIPELKMLSIWSKTASSQKYFIGFPDPVVRITLIDINMPKNPTNKFPWIKVANGRVMQEIQFCLVCLIFALISAGSGSAQGAPNTLSHPQGKKFRPVNQMWIEYIKDIRQVTIYRAKSFQLETGVGKTGGAHDRGMKRLFTPCYDHLQSCASTFLLSSVHTLWKLFSLYGPVKDAHYEDTYYVYLLLRPLRILCKPFFLTTEDRTSNKRYCTTCFLQCDTLNSGHSFTHWILNKHTYLCLQLYVQCKTCICTALIQQQCVHGLRLVTTPLRIFVVTWNSPSSFSATSGYLWVTNFWQKHHRNLLATFLNLFYGNP